LSKNEEEDEEEFEEYVEVIDASNHKWELGKISSQSQIQIEFMQG
jgi:hypothetical protein